MILQWRNNPPNLNLKWMGPTLFTTLVASMQEVSNKMAVIMGPRAEAGLASLIFVIEGGGVSIEPGQTAKLPDIPFDCVIVGWTMTSYEGGSAEVTISRADYASFPTFEVISGTEKPTLINSQKNQDTALSTWTTRLYTGDVLRAHVDTASFIERLQISLRVQKL